MWNIFKVTIKNNRAALKCVWPFWRHFGVFIGNFEHISHLLLVFLLLIFEQVNVSWVFSFYNPRDQWHDVVVITTAQLHSTKSELRFRAGSNPARGVSEICNGENPWQWFLLELRRKRLSSVNHTTKTIQGHLHHQFME